MIPALGADKRPTPRLDAQPQSPSEATGGEPEDATADAGAGSEFWHRRDASKYLTPDVLRCKRYLDAKVLLLPGKPLNEAQKKQIRADVIGSRDKIVGRLEDLRTAYCDPPRGPNPKFDAELCRMEAEVEAEVRDLEAMLQPRAVPKRRAGSAQRPAAAPCRPNAGGKTAEEDELNADPSGEGGTDASVWECQPKADVKFDDIVGLDGVREQFRQLNESARLGSSLLARIYRKNAPKVAATFLLYGPPGTGKTLLANALAEAEGRVFYSVNCANLLSHLYARSEQNVTEFFNTVLADPRPSVVLLDEAETLLGKRDGDTHEASKRVTAAFLQCLDEVRRQPKAGHVKLIAATNLPFQLDEAYPRRFDHRFECPLPDQPARKQLLKLFLRGWPNTLTEEDLDLLATVTQRYSGSNLKSACAIAIEKAFVDTFSVNRWRQADSGKWVPCARGEEGREIDAESLGRELFSGDWDTWSQAEEIGDEVSARIQDKMGVIEVDRERLERTLRKWKPTVSSAYLAKCDEFTHQMGSSGARVDDDQDAATGSMVDDEALLNALVSGDASGSRLAAPGLSEQKQRAIRARMDVIRRECAAIKDIMHPPAVPARAARARAGAKEKKSAAGTGD